MFLNAKFLQLRGELSAEEQFLQLKKLASESQEQYLSRMEAVFTRGTEVDEVSAEDTAFMEESLRQQSAWQQQQVRMEQQQHQRQQSSHQVSQQTSFQVNQQSSHQVNQQSSHQVNQQTSFQVNRTELCFSIYAHTYSLK